MAITYLKKSPKTSSTDDTKTSGIVRDLLKNIDPKDPTNYCLDVAIITAPEKRTKKTKDKLNTIAGRVLNK